MAVAVLYTVLRLVFIYGDTGAMPDGSTLTCHTGPDCVYQRDVQDGQAADLAPLGINDGKSLEAAEWSELSIFGVGLIVLTVAGGVAGGVIRTFSSPPKSQPLPVSPSAARPRPQNSI